MANTDTTFTDKNSFSTEVIDKKKYETLSQEEKETFEFLKNSILEMYGETVYKQKQPDNINGIVTFPELRKEILKSAENFAFINLKGLHSLIDKRIEIKIKDFENNIYNIIENKVNEILLNSNTGNGINGDIGNE